MLLTLNMTYYRRWLARPGNGNGSFRAWLFGYWKSGNVMEVISATVSMFGDFMLSMTSLSLANTVQFLRLTKCRAPQPIKDFDRVCNALATIARYTDSSSNLFRLSIGFQVKDNGKQSFLERSFLTHRHMLQKLQKLQILVLRSCHKRGTSRSIDLLDGVIDAVKQSVVYLDLSFMIDRRRNV